MAKDGLGMWFFCIEVMLMGVGRFEMSGIDCLFKDCRGAIRQLDAAGYGWLDFLQVQDDGLLL